MNELGPSLDPKKIINQETGQIEDVEIAEAGARAEDDVRNVEFFTGNAAIDYMKQMNPTLNIEDAYEVIKAEDTLGSEDWKRIYELSIEGQGEHAMAYEVGLRAESLLGSEFDEVLVEKVREAAEAAFEKALSRIKEKAIADANAAADELLKKLESFEIEEVGHPEVEH